MASSAVMSQSHSGQLHHHHAPAAGAGSMMARVERLDLMVGYLEEMRHHGNHGGGSSARSSTSPSTPTTLSSSSPTTPRSTGRCRPAEELLRETRTKGSLVERIAFLENRVLRMEEESCMSTELRTPERTSRLSSSMSSAGGSESGSGRRKKGLKSLVKSCVRGGAKLKTKD